MGKSVARIYISNFEHNIQEIKKYAPEKKICIAVKANAYGHGAIEIAKKAIELGVEYLSVATVEEGVELRKAGISEPILLLSLCHYSEIDTLVSNSITPLVADVEFVSLLIDSLLKYNIKKFPVHIKVDTGMARYGVLEKDALELAKYIQNSNSLLIEGTCTHLSVSDSLLEENRVFTEQQIEIFQNVVDSMKKNSINPGIIHCCASGGILLYKEAHFDMIRPGILTYGYFPSMELQNYFSKKAFPNFLPVMELVSYVVSTKKIYEGDSVSYGRTWKAKNDTQIATIALGYGDGYNRRLSNNTMVTINAKKCRIIGRICMDQCVIELASESNIKRWDEAIIFGPNKNCNTAMDIANTIDTIPYEVLCLIAPRVERIYI